MSRQPPDLHYLDGISFWLVVSTVVGLLIALGQGVYAAEKEHAELEKEILDNQIEVLKLQARNRTDLPFCSEGTKP